MARIGNLKMAGEKPQAKKKAGAPPAASVNDDLRRKVLIAAAGVYGNLRPGLDRGVYARALAFEFADQGFKVDTDFPVTVDYKGQNMGEGFCIDLLLDGRIMVFVTDERSHVLRKQALGNYMRHTTHPTAFMMCFNVEDIREGIIHATRNEDAPAKADTSHMN